ncbi:ABC-type lipoprotein release transport system permease subunit [Actinokineospora baliensis]|uniref:ABC transporter permease n=1 Tax=Actinokineospora baliensis TaxID=547056 RepID=UPI00195DA9EA|nr:ABC transporter permease [Actinokineospora baliensis]MBM7770532.1 ABC-type lipoprotein release transport system permease subunit [Actinokineospora baliensis]
MRAWLNDFGVGVRLAVSGGRTSLARFVLSTIGVGLAVAVLLLAASVGPILDARAARELATAPDMAPIAGVAPTLQVSLSSVSEGRRIELVYLRGTGPNSPVPAGIPRLPGPGEMFVSGALAEVMAGSALGERFPQRTVGTISPDTVRDPQQLTAYLGSADLRDSQALRVYSVYKFGFPPRDGRPLEPDALLLLLLGTIAVLIPVFIFLVSSTRIAGVERDRRLSALRLVGSDNRQIRRIAAAEALVSSVSGLVLGAGLFLVGRQLAAQVTLFGASVYPEDIVPVWWMAALVVLAAPVLAVFAAQFALRRTIIEPLGVVRHSKPTSRRVLWRLAVVVSGVLVLGWRVNQDATTGPPDTSFWAISIAVGVALVLLGVPALLPWLVERSVSRLRGGPTSWQMAVRRLQLDSGTSSRVVSGVAVVLAGAIAMQATFASQADDLELTYLDATSTARANVYALQPAMAETERVLDSLPAVAAWSLTRSVEMRIGERTMIAEVMSCELATTMRKVPDCVDGKVYREDNIDLSGFPTGAKTTLYVPSFDSSSGMVASGEWVVPGGIVAMPYRDGPDAYVSAMLLVTPGAIPQLPPVKAAASYTVQLDGSVPDASDRLRDAIGLLSWQVSVSTSENRTYNSQQETFLTIRRGLLIGAIFTLLLAGLSLLVLAVEHIRERKRPLAVLAAGGVPTAVLARSLLWQIAIPIAIGVVVAVSLGSLLAAQMMLVMHNPLFMDWAGVTTMAGAAAALVLIVSLLTLPFLRSATRLDSLRTE